MSTQRPFTLFGFLPYKLLLNQLKYNIASLALWILLIAMMFGGVGRVYGIHYLFLDPEYLHRVSFLSFFWVGLALGTFTMYYHITSFILFGHRYPFIGVLDSPFTKFSVNNALVPALFLLVYLTKMIWFHWANETIEKINIVYYALGLITGFVTMTGAILSYLRITNKNIFKYLAGSVDSKLRRSLLSRRRMMQRYKESRLLSEDVAYYLSGNFRVKNCQKLHDFPDRQSILRVFDQNHFNSVLLGIVLILFLLLLGLLVEQPWAQIPAAASGMLLFAMLILLLGAITYWFRGWGIPFFICLFIVLNVLSKVGWFNGVHAALGLNYEIEPVPYTEAMLQGISNQQIFQEDKEHLIQTLENWRRMQRDTINPKLVLVCVSGGGQRAALWTTSTMQQIDRHLNGKLLDYTFSITGASGGMIGAAYYRQLYLRKLQGNLINLNNPQWVNNIGKDNLNALIFSLISNDIFMDIKKEYYGNTTYYSDRGTLFESNLNKNLDLIFHERIGEYAAYEASASIPMIIMSPVISNDGKRLFISASPVSYLTKNMGKTYSHKDFYRGVEFRRFFKDHQADSLSTLSALRMSASFPYITPSIRLPSDPQMQIMDAGVADNFGITDALHLTYVAKDWINEHTDGVLMLVIRDTKRKEVVEPLSNPSIVGRFTYPISSVYNNISSIQDGRNSQMIEYASEWLDKPIEKISFEYDASSFASVNEKTLLEHNELSKKEVARASLSWHLTAQEKNSITSNFNSKENQKALKSLVSYFQ